MLGGQIIVFIFGILSIVFTLVSIVLEIVEWKKKTMERSLALIVCASLPIGFSIISVIASVFNIYFIMNWSLKQSWKYESTYMGPSTWLQFVAVGFAFFHMWMLVAFHHLLPSAPNVKIEPMKSGEGNQLNSENPMKQAEGLSSEKVINLEEKHE